MHTLAKNSIDIDEFLYQLRAIGRFSFSLSEIQANLHVSEQAALQAIFRAKLKQKILPIRRGYYAMLAPEYSKQGMIPLHLYIDDLMKFLHRPYYVAGLTAAALYGASHQQPMEYFVVTQPPALRSISTQKFKINFQTKKGWDDIFIRKIKTEAGYMNASSPELTAYDLIFFAKRYSMNLIAVTLKELQDEIKILLLKALLSANVETSHIQRLGYIFDLVLNNQKLTEVIWTILNKRNFFPVPLSVSNSKQGELNTKWKIIINAKIELDI